MRHPSLPAGLVTITLMIAAPAAAQDRSADAAGTLVESRGAALEWTAVTPEGFAPGMKLAVVRGDPAAAGEPYVVRLRFPDDYRFPPHWHPVAENVTVLDGVLLLAMGDRANDAALKRYEAGDYLFIEPRHPHFGGADGATTIQLHGRGPFEIITVGTAADGLRTGGAASR